MMEGPVPDKHITEATEYARAYAKGHGVQDADSYDMQQEAALTVMKAWRRYDPNRGATFRTFVWQGVKGSVVRWIERQTGRPGSARARARHIRIDAQGKLMRL